MANNQQPQGYYPQPQYPGQPPYGQPMYGQPGPDGYGAPPPPLPLTPVISEKYCLPYPVHLIMKEKVQWVHDDMDITDTRGVRHFRLRTKLMSIHGKRTLLDQAGIPVCCIMSKKLTLHHTTYTCPGEDFHMDHHIAEIKKTILSFTPHLNIYLKGSNGTGPDFEVDGTILDRNFEIKNARTGQVLAQVSRQLTAESAIFGKDTYVVLIYPGADMAFITALVNIIEEAIVEERQE